jgi:hypothetical protein
MSTVIYFPVLVRAITWGLLPPTVVLARIMRKIDGVFPK